MASTMPRKNESTPQSAAVTSSAISWALTPLIDDDRDDAEKLHATRELLSIALETLGDQQREITRLRHRLAALLDERRAVAA